MSVITEACAIKDKVREFGASGVSRAFSGNHRWADLMFELVSCMLMGSY